MEAETWGLAIIQMRQICGIRKQISVCRKYVTKKQI